jgi:hypothetical protein
MFDLGTLANQMCTWVTTEQLTNVQQQSPFPPHCAMCRVARLLLVQQNKMGKIYQSGHKICRYIYKMAMNTRMTIKYLMDMN